MCGHGTIGLIVTLAHVGRIKPGDHRIETPVGIVTGDQVRATHQTCAAGNRHRQRTSATAPTDRHWRRAQSCARHFEAGAGEASKGLFRGVADETRAAWDEIGVWTTLAKRVSSSQNRVKLTLTSAPCQQSREQNGHGTNDAKQREGCNSAQQFSASSFQELRQVKNETHITLEAFEGSK